MSTKLSIFPRAATLAGALMIAALPALAETATPAATDTKPATQVSGETAKKADKSKTHTAAHKPKQHAMKTAATGGAMKNSPAPATADKPAEDAGKGGVAK